MIGVRRFNSILTECLDLMKAGATVEQCLARYPKQAAKLRPMLSLADKVSQTPLVPARPTAAEQAWTALQKRTAELRAGGKALSLPSVRMSYSWLKPVGIATALLLAMTSAGGGVVYASQDALPDSPLYRVKLASEDARLWFVFDESHEANILLDQSDERVDEILEMRLRGKPVPENALSALYDRNRRAVEILDSQPENTSLRARINIQVQEQEDLLLALWGDVEPGTLKTYTETVAYLHNTRVSGITGVSVTAVRPEELAGGFLTISGEATPSETPGLWRVGGFDVRIDEQTIGSATWTQGGAARVLAAKSSSGRLHALSVSNLQLGAPDANNAVVSGAVESVSDEGITVSGTFIAWDENTLRIDVQPGQRVQITLGDSPEGVVANTVSADEPGQAETVWFEGTVETIRATSQWRVSGYDFEISDNTTFDARSGSATEGARVQIEAVNVDNQLLARRVTVLSSQDPAASVTVMGTFDGYDDSQGGAWRVSGLEIVPPPNAKPENDPPLGALVVAETVRDGNDLTSPNLLTVIQQPGSMLVQLQGTIRNIEGSRWTLEIGDVLVRSTARVTGTPDVGVRAIVWGQRGTDGTLQATYARVLDDSPVLALVGAEPTPSPQPPDVGSAGP